MAKRKELLSLVGFVAITVVALLANVLAGNTPALGLDLQGGASVTLEPVGAYESDAIDIAKDIIQQRVDSLGIAEPEIIRQGDTIVVNLPGVKDQEEALTLVGRTGAVQLRPVLAVSANVAQTPDTTVAGATTVPGDATATTVAGDTSTTPPTTALDGTAPTTAAPPTTAATSSTAAEGPARQPMAGTTVAPSTTDTSTTDTSTTDTTTVETTAAPADGSTTAVPDTTAADASSTTAPATATTAPGDTASTVPTANGDPTQTVTLPSEDGSLLYTLGPAGGTGEVFTNDADAEIQGGAWGVVVGLRSGAAGEGVWNALASQCYSGTATCPPQGADGRGQMAIVLDGVVISAPTVNAPSFSGSVSITGDFSESEARQLAKILKFGAVPVQMEPQAVETVSATLGKDSLNAAIYSGLLGLALVVVFMLFYYRASP